MEQVENSEKHQGVCPLSSCWPFTCTKKFIKFPAFEGLTIHRKVRRTQIHVRAFEQTDAKSKAYVSKGSKKESPYPVGSRDGGNPGDASWRK